VRLTLVRNATLILEVDGRRVLVDPMLDDAGTRPPVESTRNPSRTRRSRFLSRPLTSFEASTRSS
jgi:L-ascorbate metabolism protein UlaG (beta-lactamase superfamily)